MNNRNIFVLAGVPAAICLGLLPGLLLAQTPQDTLEVSLSDIDPGGYTLTAAPNGLGAGDFSSSASIRLEFLVHGFEFTPGEFGGFDLALRTVEGSGGGGPTDYPLQVTAEQNGNPDAHNLRLTPAESIFDAAARGDIGSTRVGIHVQCGGAAGPCPDGDGDQIVANLQFDDVGNKKLGTAVKVQVALRLVHPDGGCLALFNFNTDMTLTEAADETEVVVINSGRNAGRVNATTPHGQISNNTLVVNRCAGPENFDLLVVLDDSFRTNPHDNPGNAVFTFRSEGAVDAGDFDFDLFGAETPHGQLLCLEELDLAADSSLLAAVHTSIRRGMHQSELTGFGDDQAFLFGASLVESGSGCAGEILLDADSAIEYRIK